MFNLLYAELVKLKRAKVWWLFFVAAIMPGQLNIIMALTEAMAPAVLAPEDLFLNNLMVLDVPFMQLMLSLMAGFLFAREYSERTINTLFTYPFSRLQVYFSKLIVLFLLLVLFFIVAFLSVLSTTWAFDSDFLTVSLLIRYFGFYLLSAAINFALVPVYALVTLILKNVVSSVIVGILMMIANGFLIYSPVADWSPLNLPLLLKVSLLGIKETSPQPLDHPMYAVLGLSVMFVVSMVASMIYLAKSDVHSGS